MEEVYFSDISMIEKEKKKLHFCSEFAPVVVVHKTRSGIV